MRMTLNLLLQIIESHQKHITISLNCIKPMYRLKKTNLIFPSCLVQLQSTGNYHQNHRGMAKPPRWLHGRLLFLPPSKFNWGGLRESGNELVSVLSDLCRLDGFTFSFSPIPNFAAAASDDETEESSSVTASWINSGHYSETKYFPAQFDWLRKKEICSSHDV